VVAIFTKPTVCKLISNNVHSYGCVSYLTVCRIVHALKVGISHMIYLLGIDVRNETGLRTAELEEWQKKRARSQGTLKAVRMESRTGKLKIGTGLMDSCKLSIILFVSRSKQYQCMYTLS